MKKSNNFKIKNENLNWRIECTIKQKDIRTEKTKYVDDCIGYLNFYKDENNLIWINQINIESKYQRLGIGTKLIKRAIQMYVDIYISNATQYEKAKYSKDKKNDFRYYTDSLEFGSSNIGKFAQHLVNKGILKQSNIRNPYKSIN